jgi:hypothetical protein
MKNSQRFTPKPGDNHRANCVILHQKRSDLDLLSGFIEAIIAGFAISVNSPKHNPEPVDWKESGVCVYGWFHHP